MLDARKFDWSAWLMFHEEHVRRGPDYYLTDRGYFDWTFRDNPFNPTPGEYQFALWHEGEEIVGYIGRIWSPMLVNGAERRCLWQETSFVRPDMRGKGIGTELYQWVAGEDVTGNVQGVMQPQVDRVLEKTLGAPGLRGHMERAVFFCDVGSPPYPPYLTHTFTADGLHAHQGDIARWAAALWEKVRHRYGTTTHRTKEWLRWRFIDHPKGAYRVFATDSAIAFVRVEAAPGMVMVRIVDLWGTEIEWLLLSVIDYAKSIGALAVDFLCAGWPDAEAFEGVGFARWTGVDMARLPLLFNPLDLSPREEQVTLYGAGVGQEPWYITRADNGRDRP